MVISGPIATRSWWFERVRSLYMEFVLRARRSTDSDFPWQLSEPLEAHDRGMPQALQASHTLLRLASWQVVRDRPS